MQKIYSVFDSKVGAYLQPMFFRSKGEAIRSFSTAVSDSAHDFNKYAEDFTLFELGEWDQEKGVLLPHPTALAVGKAIEFVPRDVEPVTPVDNRTRSMAV